MKRLESVDDILVLPDEELECAIQESIYSLIYHVDPDKQNLMTRPYRLLHSLSPGQRGIYSTLEVEAEVCNGLFHQYFENTVGQFAIMAFEGYTRIKALKFASILQRAITAYVQANPETISIGELRDFCASHPTELTSLEELDNDFFTLWDDESENTSILRVAYIRAHPGEFIMK